MKLALARSRSPETFEKESSMELWGQDHILGSTRVWRGNKEGVRDNHILLDGCLTVKGWSDDSLVDEEESRRQNFPPQREKAIRS